MKAKETITVVDNLTNEFGNVEILAISVIEQDITIVFKDNTGNIQFKSSDFEIIN